MEAIHYCKKTYPRFLSSPFIIRVPFFLIFSFNKGTLNQKGQKGTTQEPRIFRSQVHFSLGKSTLKLSAIIMRLTPKVHRDP